VSLELQLAAAERRALLDAERRLIPPRHTWVSGRVERVADEHGPDLVATMPGHPGRPAVNMTNRPLTVGQPVLVMIVDGSARMVVGAGHGLTIPEFAGPPPPGPLPDPTLVQSVATVAGPSANVGEATWTSTPTAGNTIICVSVHRGQTVEPLVNTGPSGAGWTLAAYSFFRSTNQDRAGIGVWHKVAGTSELGTVTVDWQADTTDGTGDIAVALAEFEGATVVEGVDTASTDGALASSLTVGPVVGPSGLGMVLFAVGTREATTGIAFDGASTVEVMDGSVSIGVGSRQVSNVAAEQSTNITWDGDRIARAAAVMLRAVEAPPEGATFYWDGDGNEIGTYVPPGWTVRTNPPDGIDVRVRSGDDAGEWDATTFLKNRALRWSVINNSAWAAISYDPPGPVGNDIDMVMKQWSNYWSNRVGGMGLDTDDPRRLGIINNGSGTIETYVDGTSTSHTLDPPTTSFGTITYRIQRRGGRVKMTADTDESWVTGTEPAAGWLVDIPDPDPSMVGRPGVITQEQNNRAYCDWVAIGLDGAEPPVP